MIQSSQTQPIVLFGGGPAFGLPETSPYVTKTEVQLKMAGLLYSKERGMPQQSPKGQIPWIEQGERRVADSTFIRAYIEEAHGIDLDAGLSEVERAQAWAIERMVENQLGWCAAWFRFKDEANFEKGPGRWFDAMPAEQRDGMLESLRTAVDTNLKAVGVGRHTPPEIVMLGVKSLAALSTLLGDKPYLFGDRPTGTDATVFAIVANVLTPFFESPLRREAEGYANLVAYVDRMMARFYPEFAWKAEEQAAA